MSALPGAPNGKEHPGAQLSAPAAMVLGSGVAVPPAALQRSRYPYLQHFAARGMSTDGGKTMAAYEIRLGIVLGLKTGRELTLTLAAGLPARALAALLEQTAASLKTWADDCDREGQDPRDVPPGAPAGAVEGPGATDPAAVALPCERGAGCPRPATGGPCPYVRCPSGLHGNATS